MKATGAAEKTIAGVEVLIETQGPEAVIGWQLKTLEVLASQILEAGLSPEETARNLGSLLSNVGGVLSALSEDLRAEEAPAPSIFGAN